MEMEAPFDGLLYYPNLNLEPDVIADIQSLYGNKSKLEPGLGSVFLKKLVALCLVGILSFF